MSLSEYLCNQQAATYGSVQVITGFAGNRIPFTGTIDAVITITTGPGDLQRKLKAVDLLVGMLISGRVPASKVGDVASIIQHGLTIKKSVDEIKVELHGAGY